MLRRLATPLRVMVLVVIFLMASAGHHVAMAGMSDAHGTHAAVAADQGHHHGISSDQTCLGGECSDQAGDCCVMGQCMLAVPSTACLGLPHPSKSILVSASAFAVADTTPILPFRPPA